MLLMLIRHTCILQGIMLQQMVMLMKKRDPRLITLNDVPKHDCCCVDMNVVQRGIAPDRNRDPKVQLGTVTVK